MIVIEKPGLTRGTHYYSDMKVRASTSENAIKAAEKRNLGKIVDIYKMR